VKRARCGEELKPARSKGIVTIPRNF